MQYDYNYMQYLDFNTYHIDIRHTKNFHFISHTYTTHKNTSRRERERGTYPATTTKNSTTDYNKKIYLFYLFIDIFRIFHIV